MSTEMSELAVVERPNGKTYRAKKPTVAQWTGEDVDGVVVHRTHDVEMAERMARESLNAYEQGDWQLSPPECRWGHFRPDRIWDSIWEDSDGSTGYPAVFFSAVLR